MVIKWIKATDQVVNAKAAMQADDEERKVRKDTKLVDVAHEALMERAAKDRATLEALARIGMPQIQREQFRGKVRKKVWDLVRDDSLFADVDLVEEVTERIVDVAEVDPYYKKIFERGA